MAVTSQNSVADTRAAAAADASAAGSVPVVESLIERAGRALHAGQPAEARPLLQQAATLAPNTAAIWLHLAATCRATGDVPAAFAALERCLALQPRFFAALLMKATLIEREGHEREAAIAYGIALALAPPDAQLDPATFAAVQKARVANRRYLEGLKAHLDTALLNEARAASGPESQRFAQFLDTTLGLRPRVQQNPSDYFYPGLPPIEFWPREHFPWLAALEAATPAIQRELAGVLGGSEGFSPYVTYKDGVPLDQWAALNHSLDWSAFHFFHHGQRYAENCTRCPATMSALALLPQPSVEGRMPAAMFSVLKPRTHIPPHTGVANVRLVMHLPLVVPPGCGFRVGNVTREWRVGEAFVFDDTIEHEAWNRSDDTRVVLIADVWHPYLSAAERDWIGRAMLEMDRYNGLTTALPL